MPNLRETQYKTLIESYVSRVNSFDIKKPTIDELKTIYNMIMVNIYNKIERLFSNTNKDDFSFDKWNDMVKLLNNDIETLTYHSSENILSLSNNSRIFKVMTSFLKALADNVAKSMSSVYNRSQNTYDSTLRIPIDILNTFDVSTSENVYIDRYNLNVKVYASSVNNITDDLNLYNLITKTLDVYIDPSDVSYIKSGIQDATGARIYYSEYFTRLSLYYDIVMPSNKYKFNFISLNLDDSKKYNTTITLTKSDNTLLEVKNIVSDTIFVPADIYKKVSIKMTIYKPTYKDVNDYVYVYWIKDIIFTNKVISNTAVISLKNISIDTSYNKLSIDVDHSNNAFSYYIKHNGILYNVTPIGSNTFKKIELNKNETHILVSPRFSTNTWSLVPVTKYGGVQLYPILDILKNTNSDLIDEDGCLKDYNSISNITIYRGYQDWLINYKKRDNNININKIYIKLNRNSSGDITNTSNSLPIHINTFKINSYTKVTDGDDKKITITLNGKIIYPEMIKFINAYTNEVISYELLDGDITYDSGTNKSSFDIKITNDFKEFGSDSDINEYIVDYYITLFSYLKIYNYNSVFNGIQIYDENNIEITNNNLFFITKKLDEDGKLNDYIFNIAPFVKNEFIYISYKYQVLNMPPIKYYTTTVVCETSETITIIPFTNNELSTGNYHLINNVNVSQLTSYTLQPGANYIETTQPFPSFIKNGNVYFANQFTLSSSSAGIILPSFLKYYAYDKPLVIVPINELSMIIDSNDNRQYAFEYGKIYLNKCPEYIPSIYFSDAMNRYDEIGKTLLCKTPTYGEDYTVTAFVSHPETFYITFVYNVDSSSSTIDILIKYNKENKEVFEQPSISDVHILQYK